MDPTTLALVATLVPAALQDEPVRIHESSRGCYHAAEHDYAWTRRGDELALGERRLDAGRIDELRATLIGAREEPADLLASIGVTPDALAAHRDAILEAATPESWRDGSGRPQPLPAELEHLISWDRLSEIVRREVRGENWGSTTSVEMRVTIAGDPPIRAVSRGLVPWMLPWTIEVGDDRRVCADPAVPRALLAFADPSGPLRDHLDGEAYWRDRFWSDSTFWRRFVGRDLDAALSSAEYAALDGYRLAMERLVVDDAMTGNVNLQPTSLHLTVSSRYPSLIDGARWWNPLEDGAPSHDWHQLLDVLDAASACVRRQPWLQEWKTCGADRTIELDVVGARGHSERNLELFVTPAWDHAALSGAPEYQLLLRRGGRWCATVWLSSTAKGALIATAKPGDGGHWLDELDVSYHPKAPKYARVVGGEVEVRDGRR